jgi:hypothetical protein
MKEASSFSETSVPIRRTLNICGVITEEKIKYSELNTEK